MILNNLKYLALFSGCCLLFFGACKKEAVDITTIEEEDIIPDTIICTLSSSFFLHGDINGDIVQFSTVAEDGSSPYEYLWSTGATTDTIDVDGTGHYSVTITDSDGCTATKSYFHVDDCDDFMVEIMVTEDNGIYTLATNVVEGNPNILTYYWSTMETTEAIEVSTTGFYTLITINEDGCYYESIVLI